MQIQTEMIREECIQFETARLLKDAGFPQFPILPDVCSMGVPCVKCYRADGLLTDWIFLRGDKKACSAPTQAQAMRWLREERSLHIEVDAFKRYGKPMYGWSVVSTRDDLLIGASDALPTYEAAVECAIKAACEFLTWKGGGKTRI